MLKILVLLLSLSTSAFAEELIVETPLASSAYLFSVRDLEVDRSNCSSLGGEEMICDSSRSVIANPIYLGLGLNIATVKNVDVNLEADFDSGLAPDNKLVPTLEQSRGLSVTVGTKYLF